ncbi:hypothetical protein TSUD_313330 [Trifolium subterraneum]|uniref:Uncharacterized protein n=1 Tax=Trifolium subterraneum TaxID=3900 RepID=A0A2Z6M705_TRISU|nr:hypothetical protein TSUD_313330 [Trifolium subterraneum]
MFSYLQSIKSISDELSLIGHPLDNLDLRQENMNTSLLVTANHVRRRHPDNGHDCGRNYNNSVFDPASSSIKKTFVVSQYCDIFGHYARC